MQTTVRNDGIATPGETVKLWPQMEFVPGPGQTAPPIAFAGTALTPLAPDAGQSATYKLTFPAPSKEGIYKVRMNLKARRPPATILATA